MLGGIVHARSGLQVATIATTTVVATAGISHTRAGPRSVGGAALLVVVATSALSCAYPAQLAQDARVAEPGELQLQVGALMRGHDLTEGVQAPVAPWVGARVGILRDVDLGLRLYPMVKYGPSLTAGVQLDTKVALADEDTLRVAIAPGLGFYPSNPHVDADASIGEESTPLGTKVLTTPVIIDWKLLDGLALSTAPTVHAALMEPAEPGGAFRTHDREWDRELAVGGHVVLSIDVTDWLAVRPECSVLHGLVGDRSSSSLDRVLNPGTTMIQIGLSVSFEGIGPADDDTPRKLPPRYR